jgi:hypothetical protein
VSAILYEKKPTKDLTHSTAITIYNIEDKQNPKKIEINLLLEIRPTIGTATEIFALNGNLFVCLGNVIQGYLITMNDEKVFEAKPIYTLNTEKVAII